MIRVRSMLLSGCALLLLLPVSAAAQAAWRYLAERAGTGGRPPRSLDKLVRDDARLLRRVHGWG